MRGMGYGRRSFGRGRGEFCSEKVVQSRPDPLPRHEYPADRGDPRSRSTSLDSGETSWTPEISESSRVQCFSTRRRMKLGRDRCVLDAPSDTKWCTDGRVRTPCDVSPRRASTLRSARSARGAAAPIELLHERHLPHLGHPRLQPAARSRASPQTAGRASDGVPLLAPRTGSEGAETGRGSRVSGVWWGELARL